MQDTFEAFEDWLDDDEVPQAVEQAHERAVAKLKECLPFEEALVRRQVCLNT